MQERRKKPRICVPFSALVRGWNEDGERFKELVKLENLSASGLYFKTNKGYQPGGKVCVTILLSFVPQPDRQEVCSLSTLGEVKRVDRNSGSGYGVAIQIQSCEFKYLLIPERETVVKILLAD
jgi:hypothetical protein